MDKEFKMFADYNLGKIGRNDLPKRLKKRIYQRCDEKFDNEEIPAIDAEAFNKEMSAEVKKEYDTFTSKWWIKLY